ncbi:MAG: AAA family ATPase [Clostridia bacterium]|nr:AAA family ATPase [Clostridia bacterium]
MLVLLSGVSGAGKDTIKKELLKRMRNITTIPSYTDRLPRSDEERGKIYNFITTQEFEQKIKENEFYEYSVHHEHYYGTSKQILNDNIKKGKIIIKDIEVNGTENLLKLLKDNIKIVTIFLRVPKDELRRRLEHRIEKSSIKEIELRLNRFDYEESKIGIYDYVIKNDNLEKTVQIIMTIIENEYKLK